MDDSTGNEGDMVDFEQVMSWAHEAVRSDEAAGAHLDFSRESVSRLENLLQRLYESQNWDDVDDESVWNIACRYGAYLGETMLRNDFGRFGFVWGEDTDGEPCLKPTAQATGVATTVSRIVPLYKCFKRLRNGSSESVMRFYASCLSIVSGRRQVEILKSLEKCTADELSEHANDREAQSTGKPNPLGGSWTYSMSRRVQGRRFSVGVPDQYALVPGSDNRQLARYTEGIEDESECPVINYCLSDDLECEAKEVILNDIIPEARVQLMRKALYGDEMVNKFSRVVDDWLVEGRNCWVIVFEVRHSSSLGIASAGYEYDVMPVAYDHEDFLRLTDAWGHLEEGRLRDLAFDLAKTVELDALVDLRRPRELELFCEGQANADAFCECVVTVANMLNIANNARMNADLWRAIRAADNNKRGLLDNHNMQRIQAEAYNAGLEKEVAYYELFVRVLEKQAELGTQGLDRMIDVVGQYADVFIVDHITMANDEEADAVNQLGVICIPSAYEVLSERWFELKASCEEASRCLSVSSLLKVIGKHAGSDGYCDFMSICDEAGNGSTLEEVSSLLEQGWHDGLLRKRMTNACVHYACAWSDDEWHEVRDEVNARFVAEQEAQEKQCRLDYQHRIEEEIAAKRFLAETIRASIEEAKMTLSSLEEAIAEKRANLGQLQEDALEVYAETKSISDEVSSLGVFAFGRKRALREKLTEAQARAEQGRKAIQDAKDDISRLESKRDELKRVLSQQESDLGDIGIEIANLGDSPFERLEHPAISLHERVIGMMEAWACPVTAVWCKENVAGLENDSSAAKVLEDLASSLDLREIDEGVYVLASAVQE